ncbi:MAG: selenium metabolism-associated LysR family transcriptional regulator [Eubacteriales bacterium]|nr:selenium metabolism-associated LysR family transcriptional regulator [Eubacteriales bacterium]
MELKQLESFAAVVRYQSFTRAAEVLYISQPAISMHIRQLEEMLQTKLIVRSTRSLETTAKGRLLYEYALKMLEMRDRMLADCSSKGEGVIDIGASTIPSAYILPELLQSYRKLKPDESFIIHQGDSAEIAGAILEGVYDLGLIGMDPKIDGLCCVPFCSDRMALITPANEFFMGLEPDDDMIVELIKTNPVILREKGSGSKKSADIYMKERGINENELNVVARVNDPEVVKNLVAAGLGISIISECAARYFKEDHKILMFELPKNLSSRMLYVVYRKDDFIKDSVREFMEFIIEFYR